MILKISLYLHSTVNLRCVIFPQSVLVHPEIIKHMKISLSKLKTYRKTLVGNNKMHRQIVALQHKTCTHNDHLHAMATKEIVIES